MGLWKGARLPIPVQHMIEIAGAFVNVNLVFYVWSFVLHADAWVTFSRR